MNRRRGSRTICIRTENGAGCDVVFAESRKAAITNTARTRRPKIFVNSFLAISFLLPLGVTRAAPWQPSGRRPFLLGRSARKVAVDSKFVHGYSSGELVRSRIDDSAVFHRERSTVVLGLVGPGDLSSVDFAGEAFVSLVGSAATTQVIVLLSECAFNIVFIARYIAVDRPFAAERYVVSRERECRLGR
jgi:hypothetical protein